MTCGARSGRGSLPSWRVGARNHSQHSRYLDARHTPAAESALQAIHWAPGAMPTWLPAPSSPTMVPVVCVPWPLGSVGTLYSWNVSYQL
jgi:hypothetical protein